MSEVNQRPTRPDLYSQRNSDDTSGTNFDTASTEQASQADQRKMEFAPMPSQHFGQFMAPISPFDMRHMSNTLPDYSQQHFNQPQRMPQISQASTIDPSYAYSSLPNQQFASQIAGQYAQQYPQHINTQQRTYSGYSPSNSAADLQSRNQYYTSQQQGIYGGAMPQQPQYPNYQGQQPGPYGQMGGSPYQSRASAPYSMPRLQVDSQNVPQQSFQSPQVIRRNSSNSSLHTSSTLRGPPRKPKQSGYALWVGNLPPGTQIIDLKDHFSRDATDDIESVFLISKSNCAFVNYKTEDSCAAAMARFHDSRFRGVRLVCRLRRGSNSGTSPASATIPQPETRSLQATVTDEETAVTSSAQESNTTVPDFSQPKIAKEKFFIVKSLTVEDLERSVTSGIWATQAHNEENLNLAFKTAENVYLIFSANKSGEYYGYARMESNISADVAAPVPIEETPVVPATKPSAADAPLTIPTPATTTAPRGHIIDDSARGTIFWEAEGSSLVPGSAVDAVSGDSGDTSAEEGASKAPGTQQATFGKPFKITWQSTERLPFYRTRGLRNPWNANREVKIARDGTELEPTVGRKLIGMFEQQAQINAAARTAGPPPQFGYPQQIAQYPILPQGPYGYGSQAPNPGYGRPY